MYGPHVAILLMCVSRKTRRVDFHGLTGSQRTPRVWGVIEPKIKPVARPFLKRAWVGLGPGFSRPVRTQGGPRAAGFLEIP